jgi:hypothetical protein
MAKIVDQVIGSEMMSRIFFPHHPAGPKSVNAIAASGIVSRLVIRAVPQLLRDARDIDQAILSVEGIGREAEDYITLSSGGADMGLQIANDNSPSSTQGAPPLSAVSL